MFTLFLTAAIVFLSGSEAALPNVGICSFMEYYCNALKCNTDFIKKLQKDPNGDCSAMFNNMLTCVKTTVKICTEGKLADSTVEGIVRQNGYSESTMCSGGSLEVPTVPAALVGSLPCSSSFAADANDCLKTFHKKFAADKADPSLCTEHAKAKKCVKKLMTPNCTFPALLQEMIDLSLSDYNPYCESNRDPGATGNDQCYGVKDLTATSVAARPKSTVLQALFISLLISMVFFVKGSNNDIFPL